jgi:hypothetical protein
MIFNIKPSIAEINAKRRELLNSQASAFIECAQFDPRGLSLAELIRDYSMKLAHWDKKRADGFTSPLRLAVTEVQAAARHCL